MLSWLKTTFSTPHAETAEGKIKRISGLVSTVVPAYGQIMEKFPLVILPSYKLPLPKDEMKIALKLAWSLSPDENLRGFVMAAFCHLANFRDDIDAPIDPTLPKGADPREVSKILAPYLAVSPQVLKETEGLVAEFEEFKRGQL